MCEKGQLFITKRVKRNMRKKIHNDEFIKQLDLVNQQYRDNKSGKKLSRGERRDMAEKNTVNELRIKLKKLI